MEIFFYLYISSVTILTLYGAHRMYLLANSSPIPSVALPIQNKEFLSPSVLIQLPIFNEANVISRLIDQICCLDWPIEHLHIQVLDDSTDETQQLAQAAVERWKRKGIPISYHHRIDRVGFKAGALREGMQKDNAEFIAIFDADFLPNPDFLNRVMPYFSSSDIGMVQARWGHINRDENLLTSLSAILLDGHFIIEHSARNQMGCFFNFNGTAGVWRKSSIQDAGGWSHDTITEDLDLSYRSQLLGSKFLFLPDVIAPAELPARIHAFRLQQYRWSKGSIQTAKKLLGSIFTSSFPIKVKIEAFFHLSANIGYPICLTWIILLPWVIQSYTIWSWLWEFGVIFFGFFGVLYFYGQTMYKSQQPISILRLLLVLGLGVGMSINQTLAFFAGLFPTKPIFVRTPKSGGTQKKQYSIPLSPVRWLELLMMFYCFFSIYPLFTEGIYLAVPLLAVFGWGFGFVSGFFEGRLFRPFFKRTENI